ncbi:hypothetical protein [Rheinheimera sp. F8]|uniref:hypothetical protein n=1 Tax=Rheinheimera sp. F8 TaxID=1763998 RepID=UPI000AE940DE|nr:hypothetical protein [Rheinheimera sp. F8]
MMDLLAFGNSRFELVAEYNAAGTMLERYVHGIGSDNPLVMTAVVPPGQLIC